MASTQRARFYESQSPIPNPMKSICVYCGSNAGNKPAYAERATALGTRISEQGLRLVYGGGNVGLMARWPTPSSLPAARSRA